MSKEKLSYFKCILASIECLDPKLDDKLVQTFQVFINIYYFLLQNVLKSGKAVNIIFIMESVSEMVQRKHIFKFRVES